uniref:ABC transporter domain-containing protein n=1 Tax=Photinus pyralis TaxID=7054 RepID=A0A1Y1NHX7_PHOPY
MPAVSAATMEIQHGIEPLEVADNAGSYQALLEEWLRTQKSRRRSRIGISFRNLQCIGRRASEQYLDTYMSALTRPCRAIRSLQQVQILSGFEGLILPGEMLLVLGRPGSGCSTFLKTLSGDTHSFHVGAGSVINYQGMSFKDMHHNAPGTCINLGELDVHFPELTLGQTLEFAASTRPSHNLASEQRDDKQRVESTARVIASLFGLSSGYDTRIGDALIRGVSGGEKRRTSIAEAYIGGAQVQCWDNSTRGLDSLTAQRFIDFLRRSTDVLQSTVAMSLYQASESMYKQFDKVMLLYEGREIYFGPIDDAADYFTALGFARPVNATTPDFLTSMTNPAERVAREGWSNRTPRSRDDFVSAWNMSRQAKSLRDEIAEFELANPIHGRGSSHLTDKEAAGDVASLPPSSFSLSIYKQIMVCLRRAHQRQRNHFAPVVSMLVANVVLGLIIGSAYYNLDEGSDSLLPRSTLLFFVTMLNSFVPAFEVDLMYAQRPIVEKQSRYAFYHAFVERVAFMILDFPAKVALSFMLHLPIYFMTNLRRTGESFFTYWLFMMVNLLAMAMLFRMIGFLSRSRDGTLTPVSILTLLCVLYTGYVVPPPYMVPWLGWFRYINPIAYTYEGVMINELRHRQFLCSTTIPDGPDYRNITSAEKLCMEVGRLAGTDLVDGTEFLRLKYGYVDAHMWRNMAILLAMMVIFCIGHLLAAEYIPAQKSRGEVLLFKKPLTKLECSEETGISEPEVASIAPVSGSKPCEQGAYAEPDVTTPIQRSRQTSTFQWDQISYDIKTRGGNRRLLSDISGWLKPGSLTVLMGATGAGKTTLLDVLAARALRGEVHGTIFVDGRPRGATGDYQQRMGYVKQDDNHLPTATVREAMQFSALLRQPSTRSRSEKLAYAETVLKMLDMEAYAEAAVGVPGEGLNVEQRKRLSIGVELAAMPDLVLFLDEPTSGLDSQTAWSICTLLRKLADNGHTILCTVHQPSAQLFNQFDRLILLRSGETVYFGDIGPNATVLKQYFESRGSRKCLVDENPAEWMMDVIEDSTKSADNDQTWFQKWTASTEKQEVLDQLAGFTTQPDHEAVVPADARRQNQGGYGATMLHQLLILVQRTFRDQWRNPIYLYTKTATCFGLSLVNGISFYKTDSDIQGLISLLFSCFLTCQMFSILSMLIIPRFIRARHLFEVRERDSKLYSWVILVAANLIVEVAWFTLISVFIFVCWYYPTGMYRNGDASFGVIERGGLAFVLLWLFIIWSCTISQAFAAIIEEIETAIQMSTLCFWLSLVFCGILVTPDHLPGFWKFMYRVSPLTYYLEGIAIAGIAGIRVQCSAVEMLHVPLPPGYASCEKYLEAYMRDTAGYVVNSESADGPCVFCPVSRADIVLKSLGLSTDKSIAWRNVGILAGYIVFDVICVFALYYLLRVPRFKARSSMKR